MNDGKAGWLCLKHDGHCKSIEYLEKGQDELRVGIKDARKSLSCDIERLDSEVKETYITKTEFEATKRIVYLAIGVMVVKIIGGYF